MSKKRVVLVEEKCVAHVPITNTPFKVIELHNTVEFSIGEKLSRKQVLQLIDRRGTQKVEVKIK